MTVLCCVVADALRLAERLGPDAMHCLMQELLTLALDEVQRYEGIMTRSRGDGFLALFGAPIAHEDHAQRAILAALGLRHRLRQSRGNASLLAGQGAAIGIGLHSGPVVVGSLRDDLPLPYTAVGNTTSLAVRLARYAEPGAILLSPATAQRVQSTIYCEAVPLVAPTNGTVPGIAYRVLGPDCPGAPAAAPKQAPLSQFVGRGRELAVLHELLEQVEAGRGQVVGLVGEVGMGKSRLLAAFRHSLAGKRLTYVEGHCRSYGSRMPYLPLRDVLRGLCGLSEADNAAAVGKQVHASLAAMGLDADADTPYLLRLLGVPTGADLLSEPQAEALQARTCAAIRRLFLNGRPSQPLILLVEDVQWLDRASEECLTALVESLAGARLLLCTTYRPGYRPPWMAQSYATQLALPPLSPQYSLKVVRSLQQTCELPDAMVQTILARAQGNPFFLTELTRAGLADDAFQDAVPMPDALRDVLMARLDRLAAAPKRLIQTAAVLGQEWSIRLLEALWEGPEALEPLLLELQRLEFLYERPEATGSVYGFTQVLLREVAYDGLVLSRRQTLHTAAEQALAALYAASPE